MVDSYSVMTINIIFTTILEILQISGTVAILLQILEMETFPLMERETYLAQAQPSTQAYQIYPLST